MQLEHSFTVPVGVEDAWRVLLDIELIAPCMPGAAIDSVDGDDFTGTVKVKLGPIGLTYKGKASFIEKDEVAHRAVIDARGRDARGNGTANAKVIATLTESGGSTKVNVITDLDLTGRPAQFGRGVMADVGNKLIGQFADCLAGKLTEGAMPIADAAPEPTSAAEPAAVGSAEPPAGPGPSPQPHKAGAEPGAAQPDAGSASSEPTAPQALKSVASAPAAAKSASPPPRTAAEVEPINLIESAGPALAKRLLPPIAVALVVVIVLRRRRH